MKKILIILLLIIWVFFQTQLFSYWWEKVWDIKCSEINKAARYQNLSPSIITKIDLIWDKINNKYTEKDNTYKEKIYNLYIKVLNQYLEKTKYSEVQKEVLLRIWDYFVCKKEWLENTKTDKQTIFETNIWIDSVIRKEAWLKDLIKNWNNWEITTINPNSKLNSMEVELNTEIWKTYEVKIEVDKKVKLWFSDGAKWYETIDKLNQIITTNFKATVKNQKLWIQLQDYGTTIVSDFSVNKKEIIEKSKPIIDTNTKNNINNTNNDDNSIISDSVGGIPKGSGSGIYKLKDKLLVYNPIFIDKYYTHKLISKNKILTIENKFVSGNRISISGIRGYNQTVIIRWNKFESIDHVGIFIKNIDNIIIEGNYFDMVKSPVKIYYPKNIKFKYNKIKNHAIGNFNKYVGHHVISVNWDWEKYKVSSLEVAYNLVDRSDAPYIGKDLSDWSKDRNDAALASDYINFRNLYMEDKKIGYVHNNIEAGSEHIGEAQSGCGIIADHNCKGLLFKYNVVVNTTATWFWSANSQVDMVENIAVYTEKANRNLTYPYRASISDPNYGKILKHSVRGFGLSYYTGHGCDAADGTVGPHYIDGNRLGAWRSNTEYYIGSVSSNLKDDIGWDSPTITITDTNNFAWHLDNTTNDWYVKKYEPYKCNSNLYKTYFGSKWTPKGLPPLTAKEIYKLVFDLDYIAGMSTNWAMFSKWGTANNNEMYFDESRETK